MQQPRSLLGINSKPVVHLQTVFQGQVIGAMLLTHIEPEHGKEAYGLIDFGNGVARMSIVFLDQLKTWYPRYDYKIEVQQDFEATHPISVYKKASEDMWPHHDEPGRFAMSCYTDRNHQDAGRVHHADWAGVSEFQAELATQIPALKTAR